MERICNVCFGHGCTNCDWTGKRFSSRNRHGSPVRKPIKRFKTPKQVIERRKSN